MSWRVARSLDVLLAELNAAAPARSKVSDGSIGDAAHASRTSDHNPWVIDASGQGVVRARDFTHDPDGGLDCNVLAVQLAALLGKHPALGSGAYIIWNGRIISTDRLSEGWRPYAGSNKHTKHLHLSVATTWNRLTRRGYDSARKWGVLAKPRLRERFATFNALASHRTRPGGSMARLFARGPRRMRLSLARWNARGLSVIALQELQPDVAAVIQRRPKWDVICARANDKLGGCNAIAYRVDRWAVVWVDEIRVRLTDGRVLHMPVVQLRHRKTGIKVTVIGWHAPANGPVSGGTDGDRDKVNAAVYARALEISEETAVIPMGDSNQRDAARAFPGFKVGVKAGVDLILGRGGVRFVRGRVAWVFKRLRLSDHPLLFTVVEIEGK